MNKILRRLLLLIATLFVVANIFGAIHAYKFTHFSNSGTRVSELGLSTNDKIRILFTGIDNPRPVDTGLPAHPYTRVVVKSNVTLGCWYIPALKHAKGTVLLFHGYMGNKSASLSRAEPLLQDGYNCLLVDFMGSGGSGGNATTIGFKEAREVKDCYDYIAGLGERNIFLYGSSMGAVAIMKAVSDYNLKPSGIVIDAPFGTMYQTTAIRFRNMGVPTFPLAGILVFWGGVENGFWAFGHRPVGYAKNIKCPVLLQWGAQDERVARTEIDEINANLACDKKLVIYELGGHDNFVRLYNKEWSSNLLTFFAAHRTQ